MSFPKRFFKSVTILSGVSAPCEYGGIVYVAYDCLAVVGSAIFDQICIIEDM